MKAYAEHEVRVFDNVNNEKLHSYKGVIIPQLGEMLGLKNRTWEVRKIKHIFEDCNEHIAITVAAL